MGRRVPAAFLQLLIHDNSFQWLRPITTLIVQIDEMLAAKKPPSTAREMEQLMVDMRALLSPSREEQDFWKRYSMAVQRDPGVAVLHDQMEKAFGTSLAIGRNSGDALTNDQRVDVVGSFIGLHRFEIAHVAHDGIFVHNAVCAQQIAAEAGAFESDGDIVALQHGDVSSLHFAGVLQLRHLHCEQLAFGDFGDHPGEFFLH